LLCKKNCFGKFSFKKFFFKDQQISLLLKRFFEYKEDLKEKSPNPEIFEWKISGVLIGRVLFSRFLEEVFHGS